MRAFDALSVPDPDQYADLFALGFDIASGYTRVWTQDRIDVALATGLGVLPLDEAGTPTSVGYFTPDQGTADGQRFVAWADAVRMPHGVPFVGLTLDFDCPLGDLPAILAYANNKIDAVARRNPIWMYGPKAAIDAIIGGRGASPWPGIAGALQAYAPAWSNGDNANPSPYADIVQVGGGTVSGIPLDVSVTQGSPRVWRLHPV